MGVISKEKKKEGDEERGIKGQKIKRGTESAKIHILYDSVQVMKVGNDFSHEISSSFYQLGKGVN